ncbi:JNK-interacting protein 3-like [Centruroides sculpturatus]|uniref:JNK-interacting protein 3-like n=1 Tax=Centruroides sculpturatus TaxID=218467 RepID=UPI000C6D4E89|nr:JNK-interacting protein 3-like [Centruroides sculpturatus]
MSENSASEITNGNECLSLIQNYKVRQLAEILYNEFEFLMKKYDNYKVRELPTIITILGDLDIEYVRNREKEIELELIKEENRLLLRQFEHEKNMRKLMEQKLIEVECNAEENFKCLEDKIKDLQSLTFFLNHRAKNLSEHCTQIEEAFSRLQEKYHKLIEDCRELSILVDSDPGTSNYASVQSNSVKMESGSFISKIQYLKDDNDLLKNVSGISDLKDYYADDSPFQDNEFKYSSISKENGNFDVTTLTECKSSESEKPKDILSVNKNSSNETNENLRTTNVLETDKESQEYVQEVKNLRKEHLTKNKTILQHLETIEENVHSGNFNSRSQRESLIPESLYQEIIRSELGIEDDTPDIPSEEISFFTTSGNNGNSNQEKKTYLLKQQLFENKKLQKKFEIYKNNNQNKSCHHRDCFTRAEICKVLTERNYYKGKMEETVQVLQAIQFENRKNMNIPNKYKYSIKIFFLKFLRLFKKKSVRNNLCYNQNISGRFNDILDDFISYVHNKIDSNTLLPQQRKCSEDDQHNASRNAQFYREEKNKGEGETIINV